MGTHQTEGSEGRDRMLPNKELMSNKCQRTYSETGPKKGPSKEEITLQPLGC